MTTTEAEAGNGTPNTTPPRKPRKPRSDTGTTRKPAATSSAKSLKALMAMSEMPVPDLATVILPADLTRLRDWAGSVVANVDAERTNRIKALQG
jgi:hypothetical protein